MRSRGVGWREQTSAAAGRVVKSLTLSHKMVSQTLVTAITPAPLMRGSPAPPVPTLPTQPTHLPNTTCRATASSVSAPHPQPSGGVSDTATSFTPPPSFFPADVSDDVRALRRKRGEERQFKWTRRSKVVVAGAGEWLDWLRHGAWRYWNEGDFPNSGEVGKINCWFAAKWAGAMIWSEACLCCYFASGYLCDSYRWGSLPQ